MPTAFRWCAEVVKDAGIDYATKASFTAGKSLGEALLTPTRLYVKSACSNVRVSIKGVRPYHRKWQPYRKSSARAAGRAGR